MSAPLQSNPNLDPDVALHELPEVRMPALGVLCDLSAPVADASPLLGFTPTRPVPVSEPRKLSMLFAITLAENAEAMEEIAHARANNMSWSVMTQNGVLMARVTEDGKRLDIHNARCPDISVVLPDMAAAAPA